MDFNSDSPPFQLTRLDGLSPSPWLFLLLNRLDGAGRGVLLHGRQRVDGVEEWGDFGVRRQLGAVCA